MVRLTVTVLDEMGDWYSFKILKIPFSRYFLQNCKTGGRVLYIYVDSNISILYNFVA